MAIIFSEEFQCIADLQKRFLEDFFKVKIRHCYAISKTTIREVFSGSCRKGNKGLELLRRVGGVVPIFLINLGHGAIIILILGPCQLCLP